VLDKGQGPYQTCAAVSLCNFSRRPREVEKVEVEEGERVETV
jgi:hypothetical protein